EELENLLAGRAGPGPDEVTVDAGANLFADGHAGQQPPANVAVGDRADDPPRMVLREQDSAHVCVQPPKRFLDRLGLGDGEMALVLQFPRPKPDRRPCGEAAPFKKAHIFCLLDTAGGQIMQVPMEWLTASTLAAKGRR